MDKDSYFVCKSCGEKNSTSFLYCTNCGAELLIGEKTPTSSQETSSVHNTEKKTEVIGPPEPLTIRQKVGNLKIWKYIEARHQEHSVDFTLLVLFGGILVIIGLIVLIIGSLVMPWPQSLLVSLIFWLFGGVMIIYALFGNLEGGWSDVGCGCD